MVFFALRPQAAHKKPYKYGLLINQDRQKQEVKMSENTQPTLHPSIVNLTPHAIGIRRYLVDEDIVRVIPPTRPAVRVKTKPGVRLEDFEGLQLYGPPVFNGIINLPPMSPGKIFVVSQIAALVIGEFHRDRTDVFWPATTRKEGATRESGGVIAVSRLNRAV